MTLLTLNASFLYRESVTAHWGPLPEEAEDRLISGRFLDQFRSLRFQATVKANGTRIAARPTDAANPLRLAIVSRREPGAAAAPKNEVQWGDAPRRRSARSARICALPTSLASTSRARSTSASTASSKWPRARGPSSSRHWPSASLSPHQRRARRSSTTFVSSATSSAPSASSSAAFRYCAGLASHARPGRPRRPPHRDGLRARTGPLTGQG